MATIHSDSLSRHLYSTDASMYQELPSGVAWPESADEMADLVKQVASTGGTITARSAGTSLAGQTTGGGVIMDVSRHMNRIIHLDPESHEAVVEPGVIRDTLNREAARYGLQFGPDTSTTNRCMLGGMIGNNSAGSYSIKHRTTREHVKKINAILSDGSRVTFGPLTPDELDTKCSLDTLEGKIYREMLALLRENKEKIFENYPHPDILRRNTGYALDRLCEMDPLTEGGRPFNMAELLCGSEGTLAMTVSANVNLVPVEPYQILVIAQFKELSESMHAAVEAVQHSPSAVELVDRIILDATKGNLEMAKNRFFLEGDPACILITQFEGSHPDHLREQAHTFAKRLEEQNLGYAWPVLEKPERMNRVWELRRAGLGLLMGLGKDARSPTFCEDTAVRVQDLPAYVEEFKRLLETYETTCVFYAHASVGELHLRPVIDITTQKGVDKMKAMAADIADLVRSFRGSLSGEHGDGRARAPYIEKVLGAEMVPLLERVKEIWDPGYLFNPGKIVKPAPIDTSLRFDGSYEEVRLDTVFKWRKEGGFGQAIEQCNGAGVCRKLPQSGGTMCPSYHATHEEKDTTRGRANLFRQLFVEQRHEAFSNEEIKTGLELCLSCKACKSECPANVDMAKMKAEFLHGWNRERGTSLASRFFGQPERLYPLASRLAPLSNAVMKSPPFKILMQELAGVDARRTLPAFARQTYRSWFAENRESFRREGSPQVALLVDPFVNYHEPEIACSATRLLSALGYDVILSSVEATGRPQISRGLLDQAVHLCRANLTRLAPLAEAGIPVVGLEPSEILTLRDEYLDLVEEEELEVARRVAANSYLFEEFLLRELKEDPVRLAKLQGSGKDVSLHGHCHTKSLVGNEPMIELLELCGFQVRDLKTGCCGMAGSFGYERDNYEVSMEIGEQILFPALRNGAAKTEVCAPGFSCRHQIVDGTGTKARHPALILEEVVTIHPDT
ncbi:MAG: FAD-linked oxidase C-terminal domain-containing protein [Balneolaceae bacterium]